MSTQHPHCPESTEGRLASLRAELLPPLSPGRASRRTGRYIDQPRRVPLRAQAIRSTCEALKEKFRHTLGSVKMSDEANKADKGRAIDRRDLLLGTSSFVAAATLTSQALAQAQ